MTWADEHLRAFIDRVLRLKEEQDNLGKDIREVYAEAKANGFDKTVLGQVVAYLRKREKDPHKVEESEAIFDIYLHSYNRGTSLATHTRESDDGDRPAHDPTTGELIDDIPATGPAIAPAPGAGSDTITATDDAGEKAPSTIDGRQPRLDASSTNSEIHREPSNRDVSTDSKAYSAAASQGQAAHAGTGSETLASHEGDTQGEGASALSPINSLSGELTATGTDGGAHEDEVASTADSKSSDTRRSFEQDPGQALGSDPVSEVAAIAPASAAIAPVEPSPSHDNAPGASFPCEANGWAGLEPLPQFDRRRPAA